MDCSELIFTGHAIQRMFERSISTDDVRAVIESGKIIAAYPDDKPYPSSLLLGFPAGRPLHVVVAADTSCSKCYVVTVYVPAQTTWQDDYQTRK